MSVAEHIVRATRAGAGHTAIDFNGSTLGWTELSEAIEGLAALLDLHGMGPDTLVGLLGRNRLEQLGAYVAILGAGRGLLLVNAIRPAPLIGEELRDLGLACLMGSREDLGLEVIEASKNAGTMVIAVSVVDGKLRYETLARQGAGPFRPRAPGTLIEIQTSGTTGAPKRIPVLQRTVEASLRDGVRTAAGAVEQSRLAPKSSPTLMFGPLVHTSGTFNTLLSVFEVRPIVLFEKFDAEQYRRALVHHRPKFAALPPTALKMMVDSDATREDFASVLAVRAGTAPLPVDLQIAFEEKFDVPVLVTYGATEFMGAVTSWTLDDHRRFGTLKRGSVGRVSPGIQLRVVDPSTHVELPVGEPGILEAKLERIDGGQQWIRTTDLARFDSDGFLYILGRSDDAILRGGFKVMAGKVADVLRQYPGICDVIVVGRKDERLGEVPVAVIEPYPGAPVIDVSALREFARQRLTPYEVPAKFHLVERLPRTVSEKVSRPAVSQLLDGAGL
jgi:acyl-CoA synthetase (AMP-forming)/AMP-acid ligase II